jgi:hypothetical protein
MPARIARWIRDEWPFCVVVGFVLAAVGYLMLFPHHWRRGVAVIAVGMLVGAAFRATLSPARMRLLVVRGRILDTLSLAVMGGVILSVAIRLH